jgi:hypothetical protein
MHTGIPTHAARSHVPCDSSERSAMWR